MEIFNLTEKQNLKVWEMARKAVLLALFCFPAQVWAEQAGMDVGKYQDDLDHQIDKLKSGTSDPTPAPTVQAKAAKPKVEKKEVVVKTVTPTTGSKSNKSGKRNPDLENVQVEIDQLTQKMNSLEGGSSNFKFGLLLQGRGTINDNPTVKLSGNTLFEGLDDSTVPGVVNDEVYFRRAEMKFYGGFANNTLQYVVMIDPVGVPAATKNLVQDYFLVASPLRYVDLTFGQTKYPQGLESRTSSAKLEFINRSTLEGGNGFGDQRDMIAQVSGTKVPVAQDITLDYALAAVNGQGRNNPENNNRKDGAARLGFQYKGLWIGGSAYDGFEQAPVSLIPLEMWRVGAEGQLVLDSVFQDKDNLKFQAEWGQGSFVNENGVTKGAFTAATGGKGASGFYLESLYRFNTTRVGVRYELWDPKDTAFSSPGFYQNYMTVGLDQYFSEDHCRLSLNWIHPILDNPAGGTLSVGEVLETQVQFTF